MVDRIDAMARGLREDRFFLASALEDYAGSEELDAAGLAMELGCRREMLGRLGLCRRPDPASDRFWADIETIAARFGIEAETLAGVIRRSDALHALRGDTGERGMLAAARDCAGDGEETE